MCLKGCLGVLPQNFFSSIHIKWCHFMQQWWVRVLGYYEKTRVLLFWFLVMINRDVYIVHKFICVGVLKWDTRTFMLKLNASEASQKKIEIELLRANSCNLMRAKRAGKSKNWSVASEASENFLENFALFPPILASLGQIIHFLSRKGQIIYFQHF